MKSRQIVLGILMRSPQTGYDITQMFQTSFAFFFDSSSGMVYPVLRKLEKEGKVTKEVVPQDGKPDKNLYTITQKGKEEFTEYLSSPVERQIKKSDFLARLMFGDYMEPDQLREIIEDYVRKEKEETELLSERLEKYINKSSRKMTDTETLAYEYGVEANKFQVEFFEKWLENHSKI